MKNECQYCEIPKRELTTNDYFEKMSLWRNYVSKGILKFIGGDTPLENFEKEISKEESYVYYHYFECSCGNRIKTGVCIRSSVPILEHMNPSTETNIKGKTTYNNGFNLLWQRIKKKFNL